jgi:phage shock protein PspC (stress-responsive transcriptional regulator)
MDTTTTNAAPSSTESPVLARRSLYRPAHDRMVAGVGSGIARYLGIDAMIVRIALVVLVFVGGIAVPLYLACWLLIPEEGHEASIASEFVRGVQDWRD